ncbi:tRNA (adenine(22)-N(1))-methyltransferase [Allofustis seminis]|uniref:tRNA (adenine(22)-N(1))-methyltransferase n=1 Tax=Allofustis seminis TaxID=166939 RepID=UPI00035D772E|nr:class I SAM-dependent methyltransferase [Allofustis seminis]
MIIKSKLLSNRLTAVASLVPNHSVVLDIGTDHAFLPIELLQSAKAVHVYASEVVEGPYKNAKYNIEKADLASAIDLFLGAGFEVITQVKHPDEINVTTIAGMGGQLIAEIIQAGVDKKLIPQNCILILQPNNHEPYLRKFLGEYGYQITAEKVVEDQGIYYEVIKAIPTLEKIEYSQPQLLFGPYMIEHPTLTFYKKWNDKLAQFKKIQSNLKNATDRSAAKIKEIHEMITIIQKVIK